MIFERGGNKLGVINSNGWCDTKENVWDQIILTQHVIFVRGSDHLLVLVIYFECS